MDEKNTAIKKNNKKTIENVILLVELMLMTGISFCLIGVHEHFYQVEKDYSFYKAVFLSLLLLILIRRICFKRDRTIIGLVICALLVLAFIYFKGIRADRYGELYSKSLRLLTVNWGLFLFIIFDVFQKKTVLILKKHIKNPFLLLTFLTFIVISFFGRNTLPFICPAFLLFLTEINKDEWNKLTNIFAMGFFIAFAVYFAGSLIVEPFGYNNSGRYVGKFLNNCELGMVCAGAMICVMYFWIQWFRSESHKLSQIIILFPMTAFSVFTLWIVSGRTGETGLILSTVMAIVFLHGRKARSTLIRGGIVLGGMIVAAVSIYALASFLQARIINGDLLKSDLNYSLRHIASLAVKDSSRGAFPPNTLLNALDEFSSQRLTTWYLLGVQIIPFGQIAQADLATHSTYLFWFVRYGAVPGIMVAIWFIIYGIVACIKNVKNDKTSMFTLMWWAYCAGIFVSANEYWNAPGGYVLLIMIYPLLNSFESEICSERENDR